MNFRYRTQLHLGGVILLFLAMVFLIFALFMVVRVYRGYQAIWLGLILFFFGSSIIGLAGLVPRFGYYQVEGILSLPFDQPSWAWHLLERLSLYDFMRFRLWSAVGFLIAVVGFSFSYTNRKWKMGENIIVAIVGSGVLFFLWNYEPQHLFHLFDTGARLRPDAIAWRNWTRGLHFVDYFSLCLIGAALFYAVYRILSVYRFSSIRQKRGQAFCVAIGIAVLGIFFIILFCVGRVSILNTYTVATTLLPLSPHYMLVNNHYLLAVPFVAFTSLGAMILSIVRYGFLGTWRLGTQNIDQQIHIVNQAVRLALHSFKNRFLAVQMAMDMATSQLKGLEGEEIEKALVQIKWAQDTCAEALQRLDVLHVQAKQLQLNPRKVTLQELADAALSNCSDELDKVVIVKDYPDRGIEVWGDREHLESVLENLLQNAYDGMTEQPREGINPEIKIIIGREYEWSFIRIIDNGPGISKKVLHKVFRPFYTTKPSKNNWGLGLTYCLRVVKTHHGFLNLRNYTGGGVIAEVVLRCR